MTRAQLEAALLDPQRLSDGGTADHVAAMLVEHGLERIASALAPSDAPVLVVKGAALAYSVYAKPHLRRMDDIDIVVPGGRIDDVEGALQAAGFRAAPVHPGRRVSAKFSERVVTLDQGGSHLTVELHADLDKVASRGVDYDAAVGRSLAMSRWPRLRYPDPTDHLLLVTLHLANSDFCHPVGWVDLEQLAKVADLDVACDRARRWRMRAALFMALSTLRALGSKQVSDRHLARLRPSKARLLALKRSYRVGGFPVRDRASLGVSWLARQTIVRDRSLQWLAGVARYAGRRVADQLARRRVLR